MLKHWWIHSARAVYVAVAVMALVVGLIGIVVPLLPTTPFLLLSAWAAAKGSPRFHAWLIRHPWINEPLIAWRDEGAIPTRAKRIALTMLSISWLALALGGIPHLLLLGLSGLFFALGLFIARRPAPAYEAEVPPETIKLYEGCVNYSDLRAYSDPEVFHE